ncbi:thermonuclease family protein [Bacillus licheniformis]|uniref:thermonuclease family protein n=1 Tax=Bacillus licheniformis TaxID=1402 RepID=UPI0016487C3D|nr:thermonuclease family protein [Bacillus licheniformis]
MIDFYRVKCTRVKDGDTFVGDLSFGVVNLTLHDQVFRLAGIDTPERNEGLYFEATEYTAQHLEGKSVIVFLHGKDSFGRWLCDVYIDGIHQTLNDLLLNEGLAKTYKK